MVQFTNKDGKILDPQPSIRDVLRERMDHANLVLLSGSNNPEDLKSALEMLLEINQVAAAASLNQTLDELSKYIEPTSRVKSLIQDPRDIFSLLISQGSDYAFYLFEWIDYQEVAKNYRVKAWHDVMGKDGKVEECVWPNADRIGSYHTDDVKAIRLSKRRFPGQPEWKHRRDRVESDVGYVAPRKGL